jgi:Spy/CpxP family protein refolding chaperone
MRAAMEQVMMVRLKQALQLTPEQEPRVMPKVQHMVDVRRDYAIRRRGAVSHLRALLADETADDAAVEKGLRDLEKLDQSFREQEQGLRHDLSADLTPRQEARMYFFARHFRRSMEHRMQEAMERRRGGLPPTSPAPEADEDLQQDEEP